MDSLTPLEKDIVILVAQGYDNREIAQKLALSDQTIRNYIHAIYEKLGLHNRAQLTDYAWRMGWVGKDQDRE